MKKWLIILVIILIVLTAGLVFQILTKQEICTAEGEILFEPETDQRTECCEGLIEIPGGLEEEYLETELEILGPMGAGTICSNCGDSICDDWEHKYNCPQDCGD